MEAVFLMFGDFFAGIAFHLDNFGKILWQYRFFFLGGAGITLALSFFGVIFGAGWGLILAVLRQGKSGFFGKLARILSVSYIELVRGTPLLVQVYIIYFGINMAGLNVSAFWCGVITLAVNSGAYVAEIFRAGIQAVPKGQTEAALALGLTPLRCMRYIIVPQAFRNVIPALVNEFITIVKESSIVSVIALGELMYQAKVIQGNTYTLYSLFIAAGMYFIITFTLSKCLGLLEKRLRRYDIRKKPEKKL